MSELETNWNDIIFNVQQDAELEGKIQKAVEQISHILSDEELKKHGLKAQLAIILTVNTQICLSIAAKSPKHWKAVKSFMDAGHEESISLMNELARAKAKQVEEEKEKLAILQKVNAALKQTLEPQPVVGSKRKS